MSDQSALAMPLTAPAQPGRTSADAALPLVNPFMVSFALCLVSAGSWLLAQATAGPLYVLAFLPAIPLMLLYTVLGYALLVTANVQMARAFGFRIDFAALGPVVIYRDGRWRPGRIESWRELGAQRVVAPDSRSQHLKALVYSVAGLMLLFALVILALIIRYAMMSVGIPGIIVDLLPNAFAQALLPILKVVGAIGLLEEGHSLLLRGRKQSFWSQGLILERAPEITRDDPLEALRPRDWPPDVIAAQASVDTSRPIASITEGLMRAYYHWLDAGDAGRAGSYLDQAAAYIGPLARFSHPRLYPEMAYYLARHKDNPAAARARLRQAPKADSHPQVTSRAEAAIHLAEGNAAEAREAARRARVYLHQSPPGLRQLERELLEALVAEAERGTAQPDARGGSTEVSTPLAGDG